MLSNEKFIHYINKAADIAILSIMWAVFSIPIFTFSTSCAALYYAVNNSIINDNGFAYKMFLKSFKTNLKQCLKLAVFFAPATILSLTGILNILNTENSETWLYIGVFSLIALIILIIIQIHLYALIGYYTLNQKQLVSLIIKLLSKNILQGLMLFAVVVFSIQIIIWFPPLITLIPGLCCLTNSFTQQKLYNKYIAVHTANNEIESETREHEN